MTKDETIDMIIDDYKKGNQSAMRDYCNRTNCDECQFTFCGCASAVVGMLIERLTKDEKSQKEETNLEHYFNVGDVIVYLGQQIIHLNDNCWDAYKNSKSSHIVEWLLLPYEEPKPKYKLSKFEYDLLQVSVNKWERILKYTITDSYTLEKMADRGYFKNIPLTISIKDILGNCEVIDE